MKALKVGIIGFGTVGTGVYNVLQDFKDIEIKKIAVKNINKKRNIEKWSDHCYRTNRLCAVGFYGYLGKNRQSP